jgi:hypothetical protein
VRHTSLTHRPLVTMLVLAGTSINASEVRAADFLQTLASQVQSDARTSAQRGVVTSVPARVAQSATLGQPTSGSCGAVGSLSGVTLPSSMQLDVNSLLAGTTVTIPPSPTTSTPAATTTGLNLTTVPSSTVIGASPPAVTTVVGTGSNSTAIPAGVNGGATVAVARARWVARGTTSAASPPATSAAGIPVGTPAASAPSASIFASPIWAPRQQ